MGSGEAPSPGGAEAPSWRPGKIPGGCSRSQIHGFYLIFLWGFIWDFEDSLGDFILNFGHFISPFVQSFGLFKFGILNPFTGFAANLRCFSPLPVGIPALLGENLPSTEPLFPLNQPRARPGAAAAPKRPQDVS